MTLDKQDKKLLELKTTPYKHQLDILEDTWNREYYAILWEMGVGKSKLCIDTVASLFIKDRINGFLIIAPKRVYLNWYYEEIEKHMPDQIDYAIGYWSAIMRKHEEYQARSVMIPENGTLDILLVNIEALRSKRAFEFTSTFLKQHEALTCIDESSTIKSPKAIQTKSCLKLGKLSSYRRIMTGTPITQSPLDLFSQFQFLKQGLLGFTNFTAFKSFYAEQTQIRMGQRSFMKVTGFRNIDVLKERMATHSSRITKEEALDLPDKVFSHLYVMLTGKQKQVYDAVLNDAFVMLNKQEESGELTITNVLTALVKIQQVTCGHCKDDEGKVCEIESNRVEALLSRLKELGDKKVIIWCAFRHDVELITAAISKEFPDKSYVTYKGGQNNDERIKALDLFKYKDCQFMISTSAASKGLTLVECCANIYFSMSYNLENFLQSQDRTHRIGQERVVTYDLMMAKDTIDEKIVKTLEKKKDLAESVLTGWRDLFEVS